MDKQDIPKLKSSLLDKLITAYNGNEVDGEISVNFDNKELRTLILNVKSGLALEEVLDYELFNRRELKHGYSKSENN